MTSPVNDYSGRPITVFIPTRLGELLNLDPALAGEVHRAVADFTPWFSLSGMPFFPYYTDHGPAHVTGVLTACEALISDRSWNVLTAADAAVLILSTLLHDSALHLREEGFVTIVSGQWGTSITGFADATWPILWSEYIAEARRWDAKRLVRIFGAADPVVIPDLSRKDTWTQRDRLLIGEFLRRHHPRIAHEIAVSGVPGPMSKAHLELPARLGEYADMAGVAARSHGLEIRSCLPYLEKTFGNIRFIRGAHPVFLMGVLRVADYLQIQSSRAPRQLLSTATPQSPISKGEWEAHDSVRDITPITEDPEALLLFANPPSIRAFLRLREWLDGIQAEIDQTWAVLGEVYGRYAPLNNLGITLRRLKSNLDDVRAFSQTVDYIPVHASFSTAEADLLKLLVAPLYGNQPEIGIRELLQNAVDAVRERELLSDSAGTLTETVPGKLPEVRIELLRDESGDAWLEVEDCGVGMTASVVKEFFLRAGASFRFSDAWRRDFEDSSGESKVLRSGRFGVGAVAAFLLGNEIEVRTRHFHQPPSEGVTFRARLEDENVELRRVSCQPGTIVRVRLYEDVAARFEGRARPSITADDWDWYYLDAPRVQRIAFGFPLKSQHKLPSFGEELPVSWRRMACPDFPEIHWSFADDAPTLVCNGIPIVATDVKFVRYGVDPAVPTTLFEPSTRHYRLYYPALSVFDPSGRLPLNLQRTALSESSYPFTRQLCVEVMHDFLAFFALTAPQRPSTTLQVVADYKRWRYAGLDMGQGHYDQQLLTWLPIFETGEGIGFTDAVLLRHAQLDRCIVVSEESWMSGIPLQASLSKDVGFMRAHVSGTGGLYRLLRKVLYPAFNGLERDDTPFADSTVQGARIFLAQETAKTARKQLRHSVLRVVTEEKITPGWVQWVIGKCSSPSGAYRAYIQKIRESPPRSWDPRCVAEVFLSPADIPKASLVANEWLAIFGQPILPFSRRERLQMLQRKNDVDWPSITRAIERDLQVG